MKHIKKLACILTLCSFQLINAQHIQPKPQGPEVLEVLSQNTLTELAHIIEELPDTEKASLEEALKKQNKVTDNACLCNCILETLDIVGFLIYTPYLAYNWFCCTVSYRDTIRYNKKEE